MKVIGITGGIGTGKTKALNFFKSKNIPCYESDRRAKDLLNSEMELIKTIKSIFGQDIYNESGIDRKALASIVFNEKESLKILNDTVHPFVKSDFDKFIKKQKSKIIFYESAIIFEHAMQEYFDKIILLISPFKDRIKRLIKRDGLSLDEIKKRISNQFDDKDKIPLSDYIINNKSWKDTILELEKTYLEIKNLE
ncbi:MAG: dephospho-CoA kinase [Flavobacteriaceae bacterium]|nr:dephospho-CoA kinase [Flavobacteriaceae bacterium]|tara:strand:+ start:37092 stop:37676 length:585 start_codon:yes stop_codon:yes gene_type:complete